MEEQVVPSDQDAEGVMEEQVVLSDQDAEGASDMICPRCKAITLGLNVKSDELLK